MKLHRALLHGLFALACVHSAGLVRAGAQEAVNAAGPEGALADFKAPLDGSPLQIKPQAGEIESAALKKFLETGVNDYRNDTQALAQGKRLYTMNCAVCHGPDGKGRMGPTLVGKDVVYKQALTDPGMFSIIYAGASGAMQSFARRGMKLDDMLKIVAYVRSLEQ